MTGGKNGRIVGVDRSSDLAVRVAAWHNRHPLAERITPQQVLSVGWVALPFRSPLAVQTDGAPDAQPRRGWTAAFAEDFIAPLAPQRVARFALRCGELTAPQDGLPVREVRIERTLTTHGQAVTLWLQTAAIEIGGRRVRVLLAAGAAPGAIGPRLWSRTRQRAVAAVSTLMLVVAAAALWPVERSTGDTASSSARPITVAASWPKAGRATVAHVAGRRAAQAGSAASAPATTTATAASAAMAPLAAASGTAIAAVTPAAASTPAVARAAAAVLASSVADSASAGPAFAAAASAATRGVPTTARPTHSVRGPAREATAVTSSTRAGAVQAAIAPPFDRKRAKWLGQGVRPHIAPSLDDATKAEARAQVLAAREARRARPSAADTTRGAGPAAARAGADAAAPPHAVVWALSTRSLRTRFESEQMLVAMRDVAGRRDPSGKLHFEVLPAGADWRAVTWPYVERRNAERVRMELQERGLRVEVVPF